MDHEKSFVRLNEEKLSVSKQLRRKWCNLIQSGENDICGFLVSVNVIFLTFLNLETLLAVASACASVALYDYFDVADGHISWTFVSFALIFPISTSLKITFHRREQALQHLSTLKALTTQLFVGLLRWDWSKREGRKKAPPDFKAKCQSLAKCMLENLDAYLTAETVSRAKHLYTLSGLEERKKVREEQMNHYGALLQNLEGFGELIEVLKALGFPANEASRLNQYIMKIQEQWERMRFLKDYRTMQVSRSYARLFLIILPVIYGPYYVSVGRGPNHDGVDGGLGFHVFAYCLAIVTQLVAVGFMCAQSSMEDPFNNIGFDNVRWADEIFEFREIVERIFRRVPDESLPLSTAEKKVKITDG